MLDIQLIRDNPKAISKAAKDKGVKIETTKLLKLDQLVRDLKKQIEVLRKQKNEVSKKIPQATDKGKADLIKNMQKVDQQESKLKKEIEPLAAELLALMMEIPNPAASDVKVGKDESKNEVIKKIGKPVKFKFEAKDYLALAGDGVDTKRAAKVSGTRFGYLKGEVAQLELALIQYAFDHLIPKGFTPVFPPVLIKNQAMKAMGYLEHGGEDETYHFEKDDLFLVGTSEQSVGPMHMDEILRLEELPKRYVAFSSCFRREAGSYGKDTKGILRVHQFDKVEMFVLTTPDKSDKEHEAILAIEEELMQELQLPYQVVKMCTGDLGDPAARKYDIETWIPSEQRYRETHSCSTTTDFQTRRLNTRFKDKANKNQFAHALNGTVFAMQRMVIAIIENYQQADGTVKVPTALQNYLNKEKLFADGRD